MHSRAQHGAGLRSLHAPCRPPCPVFSLACKPVRILFISFSYRREINNLFLLIFHIIAAEFIYHLCLELLQKQSSCSGAFWVDLLSLVCFTRRISMSVRLCPVCFVLYRCGIILKLKKRKEEERKGKAFHIQNGPYLLPFLLVPRVHQGTIRV